MGGSSPLTRGKLEVRLLGRCGFGLIPAHAGKTSRIACASSTVRAHPRSRGENVEDCVRVLDGEGSSPLTRGKLSRIGVPWLMPGLIPAHAGKTHQPGPARGQSRAHPRSRGENLGGEGGFRVSAGSSPLTRGKRGRGRHGCRSLGLIPAHAGKTPPAITHRLASWAHPRSRGENTWQMLVTQASVGSSPLTRGKPGRRGAGSRE